MSEPKFTPGPWETGKSIYQSQARVVAKKGGRIADVFAYEEDQARANAALIAAAPKMYECLKKLIERTCIGSGCHAYNGGECMNMAPCNQEVLRVLKKARGEE